jgi:hypothetical protein
MECLRQARSARRVSWAEQSRKLANLAAFVFGGYRATANRDEPEVACLVEAHPQEICLAVDHGYPANGVAGPMTKGDI